ncbi:hypothetical protein [Veillonella sp. VA139]|uniref:hypothetical protein n=1 Tax=Veillonella sp. VA139 TaxID=741830 RepID=UPI000F8DFEF1|nr:hypothetical protein [Veillonella sp. VA139]
MIGNALTDNLFTLWWQGTYVMFHDIITLVEETNPRSGDNIRKRIYERLDHILDHKDTWMPDDTREDIIQVASKMSDYMLPLIEPLERHAKESTKITEEQLQGIELQLYVIFAAIDALPTLFSYTYTMEKVKAGKVDSKEPQDIILEKDKHKNILTLLFWLQTIEVVAKEILLQLNYRNEVTGDFPRCMKQLTKILEFHVEQFKGNTIPYADVPTLELQWGVPVCEVVERFSRHVQRWIKHKVNVNTSTERHCLKLLETLKVAADYYKILFPGMIAMDFQER